MLRTQTLTHLLCVLILAACSETPASRTDLPATTPTSLPPTASQTLAPTAIPSQTPEPTSAVLSFPGANCCKARTLEPGGYALPAWMEMPLTVQVGEGWGVLNEDAARLFLLAGKGRNEFNDPSQVLVFIPIAGGDPQDVLGAIRNAPQLTSTSEIRQTTIAGFSGWQFDAVANPNPGNAGSREESIPPGSQTLPSVGKYFAPGFIWTTWTAEPQMRFIALLVDGGLLLFVLESPPAEFNSFVNQAEEVINSLALAN